MNLSYDEIDDIIRQGKEMGTYFYIYTGGEPLVRKKDLIKLCEKHSDAIFMCFTNGTLIDEEFAQNMLKVKNFVPVISVEGFEEATDSRRGNGTYQRAVNAMNLLKRNRLPFGISTCYTSANIKDVSTEAYVDQLVEWGAYFVWYFHYMPVGKDAVPELLPSPEQREYMYHQIRELRGKKPIFMLDFQNDGEYVGGVSPAAAVTSTSTPTVTAIPACSFIIPIPTSGKRLCWKHCALPCSWHTTMVNRSMKTICGPAPCWRIRKNCGKWSTNPGHTPVT